MKLADILCKFSEFWVWMSPVAIQCMISDKSDFTVLKLLII